MQDGDQSVERPLGNPMAIKGSKRAAMRVNFTWTAYCMQVSKRIRRLWAVQQSSESLATWLESILRYLPDLNTVT